jgi:glyoxylase-like metal-dependent hydrolase (beta-lactamase superfamily II)
VAIPVPTSICPGVWRVPVAMPGPLEYVSTYAVECDGGVILIDAGWDSPEAVGALSRGLEAVGTSLVAVQGVLFTHGHRDHFGGARLVRQETGAWLALHVADAGNAHHTNAVREIGRRLPQWLADLGSEPAEVAEITELWSSQFGGAIEYPKPDHLLGDGDAFPITGGSLVALHTPGHSPGHVCFLHREAGIVFTGDHVLSITTPNISALPWSVASPLGDYLFSLRRVRRLGNILALPGHEDAVTLAERATELLVHHKARLSEALHAIDSGARTVRAIAAAMTWSRPWVEYDLLDVYMAMTEALAHLLVLERRGDATRVSDSPYQWVATPRKETGRSEPRPWT